jgi:hypothetical protein
VGIHIIVSNQIIAEAWVKYGKDIPWLVYITLLSSSSIGPLYIDISFSYLSNPPSNCWIYFTHIGFLFPKVFPCLLVIISHYPISYILGENIPPREYSLSYDTYV